LPESGCQELWFPGGGCRPDGARDCRHGVGGGRAQIHPDHGQRHDRCRRTPPPPTPV